MVREKLRDLDVKICCFAAFYFHVLHQINAYCIPTVGGREFDDGDRQAHVSALYDTVLPKERPPVIQIQGHLIAVEKANRIAITAAGAAAQRYRDQRVQGMRLLRDNNQGIPGHSDSD